jgi:alpha-beta hydrolase superfamily lysophospholipase
MTQGLIHFVHGKESGPGGSKIAALAGVARDRGWDAACLDYSHTADPALRLAQLLRACGGVGRPLLLVGSSMGGWVAAEAAAQLGAHGLFLLAPALGMPGYPSQTPLVPAMRTEIVHGWGDDVIPCENAIRFARLRQCTLHLVQGDHRLNARIPLLCELFDAFLARCATR